MADQVIESLAKEIVEHLYVRFQVAEKNEKIAKLKAENKKLRALLKEVAEDAERILKGGA